MIKLYEESTPNLLIIAIVADSVSHSAATLLPMIETAKRDFPSLEDNAIHVHTYRSGKYVNRIGIEFAKNGDENLPEDYRSVKSLPMWR